MATVTFDTLQLVQQLKASGIPQGQAEAVVTAIAHAQDTLITREYLDLKLADLDHRLIELDHRLTLKLGAMLVAAVGVAATLIKLL